MGSVWSEGSLGLFLVACSGLLDLLNMRLNLHMLFVVDIVSSGGLTNLHGFDLTTSTVWWLFSLLPLGINAA